jgi:hypothetical protein
MRFEESTTAADENAALALNYCNFLFLPSIYGYLFADKKLYKSMKEVFLQNIIVRQQIYRDIVIRAYTEQGIYLVLMIRASQL